jgi:hypothetical protein
MKLNLNIVSVVVTFRKECRESIYLNPHAYWNINDVDVKCDKCDAINTVTLEKGELRKYV